MNTSSVKVTALSLVLAAATVAVATPQYKLIDLGLARSSDTDGRPFRISHDGVITGQSLNFGVDAAAFVGAVGGTETALPKYNNGTKTFAYNFGNGATSNGFVAGFAADKLNGTGKMPVIWQNGAAIGVKLPTGYTNGDLNDVNASGVAVGSVLVSRSQYGAIYQNGTESVITATTAGGAFFQTVWSINDAGFAVGSGIDPKNAARSAGLIYDSNTNTVTDLGALPGMNGSTPLDISENGLIVGSSSYNGGANYLPFIYSTATGMKAIPLPNGLTQGSAKGVNASGQVVGVAAGLYSNPYLYDGQASYLLSDVIVEGKGNLDFLTSTQTTVSGISDDGVIVGSAADPDGYMHGYALVPVPEPSSFAVAGLGLGFLFLRRRNRN